MKKKLWQWKRSWSKLAFVSTIALSPAGITAAAESETQVTQTTPEIEEPMKKDPVMTVGEDRFNKKLKLNLSIESPQVIVREDGTIDQPIRFYLYNNYPSLVRSYQITIYEARDAEQINPIQVISGEAQEGWISWDGRLPRGAYWQPNHEYKAVLEVLGTNGKKDVVHPLFFKTLTMSDTATEKFKNVEDPHELPGYGIDRTEHRGILPSSAFGKAVVQASQLKGATDITLNGTPIKVDEKGRLMRELVLEPGEHKIILEWTGLDGQKEKREETITIKKGKKRDFFFVGMADITAGKNRVTGPGAEILNADERFDGNTHYDSRIMFYLKGDIGKKTRITAQADTGEDKLSDMFKKIGDRDPRRFTREISEKELYPIYGDGSTTVSDVDTEGKFYLKIERDKTQFLWGNYTSDTQDTELAAYNRSLYGAQFKHESTGLTKFGSTKNYFTAFAAIGETRGAHNEFASTGGSLYYLKHQRLTDGSVKLKAELRDENTNRLISSRDLQEGVDYEIDNFQGRVILTKALSMTNSSSSIISGSGMLGGDNVYLVADYEYYSDGLGLDGQNTFGGRGSVWLGDHFRIGANFIQEEKETGGNYKLYGVDATWRPYKGTYTTVEYVKTESSLGETFFSNNGGIKFDDPKSNGASDDGKAFKIQQVINFSEFTSNKIPLTFEGYYSKKGKGFANFVDAFERDTTEYGAEVKYDWKPNGQRTTILKHTYEKDEGRHYERITSLLHTEELQVGVKGTIEVQDRREKTYGLGKDATTREMLAAVKVEKEISQGRHKIYGIVQGTLSREGDIRDNQKMTLGFESQISKKLRLGLEGFVSNRGNGGGISANYDLNARASVYTKVTNDLDSNSGREINTVVGTKFSPTSKIELYSEKQYQSRSKEYETSDVYGVRYKPNRNHNFEISYSKGQVKKTISGLTRSTKDINDRSVWTLGYGFENANLEYRSKVEYRKEEGDTNLKQWVTTNRLKTSQKGDWSWMGQFDYAKTSGLNSSDKTLTDFTEAAIGFAYRPIKHDRFNLFGKVTFVSGLDPEDQFNKSDSAFNGRTTLDNDDYEQRSLVYSLEGVYEFSPKFEMAFKAAHRKGELRYRGESEWFSSGATLYAARGNYKVNDKWQAQLEYRHLSVDTAKDSKAGWVTSLYRTLGTNAKVGIGYNWTDYNDDLTRLNYNSQGWFLNLVGKW